MSRSSRSATRLDTHTSVGPVTTSDIAVNDAESLLGLAGPSGSHLRVLERELQISVGQRGNTIRLQGPSTQVALAEHALTELLEVVERGVPISEVEVARYVHTLRDHPDVKLREVLEDIVLVASGRRMITPRGLAQQRYVQAIRGNDVVFGIGPAGTGKTYLAMAMAVSALRDKRVKRIILTRPAVEAGEKLGFLPGDLAEKVNPYLRPLYDALHDMMDLDKAQALIQRGAIEVAPLAFMRGRTLNDSFVILDEAQNTTIEQMKMFLTRLGFHSKAVITGDMTQTDLPDNRRSGLADAVDLLRDVDGIRLCFFSPNDVVRHPLVQKIVMAYDTRDALRTKAAQHEGENGDADGA